MHAGFARPRVRAAKGVRVSQKGGATSFLGALDIDLGPDALRPYIYSRLDKIAILEV